MYSKRGVPFLNPQRVRLAEVEQGRRLLVAHRHRVPVVAPLAEPIQKGGSTFLDAMSGMPCSRRVSQARHAIYEPRRDGRRESFPAGSPMAGITTPAVRQYVASPLGVGAACENARPAGR